MSLTLYAMLIYSKYFSSKQHAFYLKVVRWTWYSKEVKCALNLGKKLSGAEKKRTYERNLTKDCPRKQNM